MWGSNNSRRSSRAPLDEEEEWNNKFRKRALWPATDNLYVRHLSRSSSRPLVMRSSVHPLHLHSREPLLPYVLYLQVEGVLGQSNKLTRRLNEDPIPSLGHIFTCCELHFLPFLSSTFSSASFLTITIRQYVTKYVAMDMRRRRSKTYFIKCSICSCFSASRGDRTIIPFQFQIMLIISLAHVSTCPWHVVLVRITMQYLCF